MNVFEHVLSTPNSYCVYSKITLHIMHWRHALTRGTVTLEVDELPERTIGAGNDRAAR
jgi:hypothetical protein